MFWTFKLSFGVGFWVWRLFWLLFDYKMVSLKKSSGHPAKQTLEEE
jgi:hypothetical protein